MAEQHTLEIKDLYASVETKEGRKQILKGVNLTVHSGETHAIMGPTAPASPRSPEYCTMGASLMQRRRVRDGGLRVVNLFCLGASLRVSVPFE